MPDRLTWVQPTCKVLTYVNTDSAWKLQGGGYVVDSKNEDGFPTIRLGRLLKSARLDRYWTQAEASRHFGVTQATYSRWELGMNAPAVGRLQDVAEFVGTNVESVLAATGRIESSTSASTGSNSARQHLALIRETVDTLSAQIDSLGGALMRGYESGDAR